MFKTLLTFMIAIFLILPPFAECYQIQLQKCGGRLCLPARVHENRPIYLSANRTLLTLPKQQTKQSYRQITVALNRGSQEKQIFFQPPWQKIDEGSFKAQISISSLIPTNNESVVQLNFGQKQITVEEAEKLRVKQDFSLSHKNFKVQSQGIWVSNQVQTPNSIGKVAVYECSIDFEEGIQLPKTLIQQIIVSFRFLLGSKCQTKGDLLVCSYSNISFYRQFLIIGIKGKQVIKISFTSLAMARQSQTEVGLKIKQSERCKFGLPLFRGYTTQFNQRNSTIMFFRTSPNQTANYEMFSKLIAAVILAGVIGVCYRSAMRRVNKKCQLVQLSQEDENTVTQVVTEEALYYFS